MYRHGEAGWRHLRIRTPLSVKQAQETINLDPQRLAERSQFDDIDPALSTFTFADVCLSLSDLGGEVALRHARILTHSLEHRQELGVLAGVQRSSDRHEILLTTNVAGVRG